MKTMKMLGLLAIAAAAMMAFAGIASATTVKSGGALYTGKIVAANENGHISLHGSNGVTIECAGTVEGTVESHGAGVTAEGKISKLTFPNCTNGNVVHVKKTGSLVAHSTATTNNGTLTSNGAEVEVTAASIFGTITCIYTTTNTSIGTLTGGTPATLDISATIPRTGGSSLCGSSGTWTGAYKVSSPANLTIH
jgi:hypothetical protein